MDPSEVKLWLKGRDKKNLRICSLPALLKIGFVDISTADYISVNIKMFKLDKSLFKTYKYIYNRQKENTNDGAMFEYWLENIVPLSL